MSEPMMIASSGCIACFLRVDSTMAWEDHAMHAAMPLKVNGIMTV